MFSQIGKNFNIEGSTVYQLQNNQVGYENAEEIIQEESPDENDGQ